MSDVSDTSLKRLAEQVSLSLRPMIEEEIKRNFDARPQRDTAWTKLETWIVRYRLAIVIPVALVLAATITVLTSNAFDLKPLRLLQELVATLLSDPDVMKSLAIVIGGMVIFLIKRTASLMKVQLDAAQLKRLEQNVDKAMTLSTVRASDVIKQYGWDSNEAKSTVLTGSLPILLDKYHHSLAANRIDLNDEECRLRMMDQMERMLPDVFTRAAASPATPPSDVVGVAAVTASAGP